MKRNFDFHIDKRTKIFTALTIIIFLGGAVLLYFLYTGGFLSAWFTSLVLAITALMVLSVPRKVVKVVSKREMRWTLPIFAAMGFFGYYGKFIDLKEFDLVSIYASEWNNFVEITDIYDSRTYISCRDADQLIEAIEQAQNTIAKQMEQDDKSDDSLTLHSYWE